MSARSRSIKQLSRSFIPVVQALEARQLMSAGDLDVSFAGDGTSIIDLPGSTNEIANAVAVQVDGKIVTVGRATVGAETDFFVARANEDGTADLTFGGGDGVVFIDHQVNDEATDVAIDETGKIIVVGTSSSGSGSNARKFAVARLNSVGVLDTSFSTDGKVLVDFGINADAQGVAIDGTAIYVGGYKDLGTTGQFALVKLTTTGAEDTTYSTDGEVFFGFGGNNDSRCYDIAVDAEGRVVMVGYDKNLAVVGSTRNFAYARVGTNALLDTTFSGDGLAVTDINGDDEARAVGIDLNDRIVVGGFDEGVSNADMVATRLSDAGALDSTFNGDGRFGIDLGGVEQVDDLVIDGDGTITLSGMTGFGAFQAALVQITAANGQLSSGFGDGGDGIQLINFGGIDDGFSVAMDPRDGRFVVAGTDGTGKLAIGRVHNVIDQNLIAGVYSFESMHAYPDGTLLILDGDNLRKLHTDGTPDLSFSLDGSVDLPAAESPVDLAIDQSNRILVLSQLNSTGIVRRILPDGNFDTHFSGDGVATVDFNTSPGQDDYRALAADANNRIVVVGDTDGQNLAREWDFALARLTSTGSIDSTFSGDGVEVVDMSTLAIAQGEDTAKDVLIQPDGKIVAVGYAQVSDTGNNVLDFAILRLNSDGSKDLSFSLGEIRVDVGVQDQALSVALDSAGRLVIGGMVNGFGETTAALMRLESDGDLDPTFSGDGISTSAGGTRDRIDNVEVMPDGKIVAIGVLTVGSDTYQTVRRVLSNGSGDTTFSGDGFLSIPGNLGSGVGAVADNAIYVGAGSRLRRINFEPVVAKFEFQFQNAPQRMHVQFSDDIGDSLSNFDLIVRNTTSNTQLNPASYSIASYDHLTNKAVINFNGVLGDGDHTVTFTSNAIENRQGMNLTGDLVKEFFFLNADANLDRKVNTLDFNVLAGNFGTSGKLFSEGNFSVDVTGQVNSLDFNILVAHYGVSFPASANLPAAAVAGPALFGTLDIDPDRDPIEI